MLLEHKVAVIYGAGGAVGGAVARRFAADGARVFLAGRTPEPLETVARAIRSSGGDATTARVDALDRQSIEQHASDIMATAGRLDISFNAIGLGDTQGAPLVDMHEERFVRPVITAMRTQFLTTTVAARHMAQNRSGVILAITARGHRQPDPVEAAAAACRGGQHRRADGVRSGQCDDCSDRQRDLRRDRGLRASMRGLCHPAPDAALGCITTGDVAMLATVLSWIPTARG